MTDREVRVSFKKQLNDGNYGGETVEVTLSDFVNDDAEELVAVESLLMAARRYVHAELYRSPSPRVRGALAPVPAARGVAAVVPPDPDDDTSLPF